MRSSDAIVAIVAVLMFGCARTPARRAPPDYQYSGATDPIPAISTVEEAVPEKRPAVTPPARVHRPADDNPMPLTVSGIALDPTLSSACQLPPSPKAFFEFDSADLDGRDITILRRVAACLTEGPLRGQSVELVGRTDPVGSSDYNERLARTRAEAVRGFLVDQGVPPANIVLRIAAEALTDPLWPPGWDFDRRVDIRLIRP